jgi:hypothetical protein
MTPTDLFHFMCVPSWFDSSTTSSSVSRRVVL